MSESKENTPLILPTDRTITFGKVTIPKNTLISGLYAFSQVTSFGIAGFGFESTNLIFTGIGIVAGIFAGVSNSQLVKRSLGEYLYIYRNNVEKRAKLLTEYGISLVGHLACSVVASINAFEVGRYYLQKDFKHQSIIIGGSSMIVASSAPLIIDYCEEHIRYMLSVTKNTKS